MSPVVEETSSTQDHALSEDEKQDLAALMAAATPAVTVRASGQLRRVWQLAALCVLVIFCAVAAMNLMGGTASNKLTYVGNTISGLEDPNYSSTATDSSNAAAPAAAQVGVLGSTTTQARTDTDAYTDRQVHKTATVTVQVADPESSGEQIEDLATASGGFVTTSDLTTGSDSTKSYTLSVKVPVQEFETVLAQIAKLGSIQDKEVTSEDITDQVGDAGQREQVLEDDMDQALDQIQKKGSHSTWDLQQDARDMRIRLAQSRAHLQLLRGLAELSEIDVTLVQPAKAVAAAPTGFLADVSNSASDAMQSSVAAVATMIAVVFWILAYAPLWLPACLAGRWVWRRFSLRKPRTP